MKANILSEQIDKVPSDTLVLTIFKDEKPLKGANGLIDWRLCGKLSHLLMNGVITGAYHETALVLSDKRLVASRVLIVGLGDSKEFNDEKLKDTANFIAHTLKKISVKKISIAIPGSAYFPQDYVKTAESFITAFVNGCEKRDGFLEMLIFETGKRIAMVYEGAKQAKAILKDNLILEVETKISIS